MYLYKNINLKYSIRLTLELLVVLFPIIFFLRSALVNVALILISLFFIIEHRKNLTRVIFTDDNKYLLLFFFSIFFSQIINNYKNLYDLVKCFFLFKFFFLFLSTTLVFNEINKKKLNKYYVYLKFIIFFFLIDLLFQRIFLTNLLDFPAGFCIKDSENNIVDCSRFAGIFGTELIAGGYISSIILSFFILDYYFNYKKILTFIPFLLFIITVLTGERASSVVVLIFNIFFYFFNDRITKFSKFAFISFVILFLALISHNNSFKQRFYQDINKYFQGKNINNKIESFSKTSWGLHFQTSMFLFIDKPIFGGGYKTFQKNCNKVNFFSEFDKKSGGQCSTHPHNFHFEILLDSGLLGYMLFIIFFLKNFKSFFVERNTKNLYLIFFLFSFIFFPRSTGSVMSTIFGSMFWYTIAVFFTVIKKNNINSKIKL